MDDVNVNEEQRGKGAEGQSEVPVEPAMQEDELTKAKAEAAANLAGWRRATADYANLKRESERSQREIGVYAIGSFVERLLPVVEGFRQAMEHRPIKEGEPLDEKRVAQWVDGMGHVRSALDTVLSSAGVKPINEENVPFDPNLHEAMLSEKREGVVPGTVLKVLEGGAKLNDRVLKPARVMVSE